MNLRRIALAVVAGLLAGLVGAEARAESRIIVLSDSDVSAYQRAFTAADKGDWSSARAALSRVEDRSVVDHVEARALMASARRPTKDRLVSFLSRHPDHVYAYQVRQRALQLRVRRLPAAAPVRGRVPNLSARGATGRRADLAALRFGEGDFMGARAEALLMVGGPANGAATWWLGLISWREGAYEEAARWFEQSAADFGQGAWERTAAHYWRGRALLALGRPSEATRSFDRAAGEPDTFYGQLAEVQLGRDSGLKFDIDTLDADRTAAFFERFPNAYRAAALAQIGELADAERELAALHNRSRPEDDRTQLALAVALNAPSAQLRVAEYGGPEVAAGYCPTTTFEPEDGFRVDRALLYAIVRQESRFSPIAISSANARGLMQVLPSTAQDFDATPFVRAPGRLHDPGVNMRLGQLYVEWLRASDMKGGQDLARIFAAYNGGPNWLVRWEQVYPSTPDPLLWLESIPRIQSREYAERVLSHMAICRKKFGQEPVELVAMAAGAPAIYRPLDR